MISPYHFSLKKLRSMQACSDGVAKLIRTIALKVGGIGEDAPISIGDVAISNGVVDAFWCVSCIESEHGLARAALLSQTVDRMWSFVADNRLFHCIYAFNAPESVEDFKGLRALAAEARDDGCAHQASKDTASVLIAAIWAVEESGGFAGKMAIQAANNAFFARLRHDRDLALEERAAQLEDILVVAPPLHLSREVAQ